MTTQSTGRGNLCCQRTQVIDLVQPRRQGRADEWVNHGLVFDRGNGEWSAPTTVQDAFEHAVTRAKLSKLTPHGMRPTMATVLLAAGVHPKVVQERLGHSSIQTTPDRYSHVSMSMQQDAATMLDQLIGSGSLAAKTLAERENPRFRNSCSYASSARHWEPVSRSV
jgi:hypothetical protein